MMAINAYNLRFRRDVIVLDRAGVTEKHTRSTKFEIRTPRYNTQVSELPTVNA